MISHYAGSFHQFPTVKKSETNIPWVPPLDHSLKRKSRHLNNISFSALHNIVRWSLSDLIFEILANESRTQIRINLIIQASFPASTNLIRIIFLRSSVYSRLPKYFRSSYHLPSYIYIHTYIYIYIYTYIYTYIYINTWLQWIGLRQLSDKTRNI